MTYAGFWRRAAALLVDGLVWGPIIALQFLLFRVSPGIAIASLLVFGALLEAYPVVFHARWGQTLGKMAAKIKVVRVTGDPIATRHAFMRSSVDLLLWVAYLSTTVVALATWDGPAWSSLDWITQRRVVNEQAPLFGVFDAASGIWAGSEVVILLFNKKRRALHDFIAGTVVVRVATDVPRLEVPRPVLESR